MTNNSSRFSCVIIHMDPKRPDHKVLWGNGNQAHSWGGGTKVQSDSYGQGTSKRGCEPGSQVMPGALIKRSWEVQVAGGGVGIVGLRAFCGTHHPSVAKNHRSRASQPPSCPILASKAHRPQGKSRGWGWVEVTSGWLWEVKVKVFWRMLSWNTTSTSTEFAETNQIKFTLS